MIGGQAEKSRVVRKDRLIHFALVQSFTFTYFLPVEMSLLELDRLLLLLLALGVLAVGGYDSLAGITLHARSVDKTF